MEEFKKPCLPIAPIKAEELELSSKITNEISDNKRKDADPIKPQNSAQLCPYKVPQWSDVRGGNDSYCFEVLKSGQIIGEIKELQRKAYWTFGRLPENDIEMAHPTISRFHAILQYRPKLKQVEEEYIEENSENRNERPPEGWYVYDLGSTHGTFLNKQRIPPKVYIRIRVGHMLRLGASSRSYILQGPSDDEEPESELSVTELKAKRQREIEDAAVEKKRLADEAIEKAKNEGCTWGMVEDADEESDLTHNPYATTNNEELFLDDPKKTLRGYFEREGLELVYKCDEMSAGSFVCRVELPIDDGNGRPIVAEVVHKGKKKDCVLQCALEACRLLDRHGVLRQANQEPLKRKQKSHESDSDDEFWDRTGDVARKRQRKANANTSVTLTYEDLLKQENDIDNQIKEIEFKITEYQKQQQLLKERKSDEGEDLDAFMENLHGKDIKLDKTEIRKLRLEEQRIKSEKQRVQKLIKIAKPIDLPFSTKPTDTTQSQVPGQTKIKKQLPMIGKRNQFSKFKIVKVEAKSTTKDSKPVKFFDSDEEETEEDEKSSVKKCEGSCYIKENILLENSRSESKENVVDIFIEAEKTEGIKTAKENETNTNDHSEDIDHKSEEIEDTNIENFAETADNCTESTNNSKKRRHRIRHRGKRQEVDIDDEAEYESSDKYAKWVPPENQSGDGFTELNKKFGY